MTSFYDDNDCQDFHVYDENDGAFSEVVLTQFPFRKAFGKFLRQIVVSWGRMKFL